MIHYDFDMKLEKFHWKIYAVAELPRDIFNLCDYLFLNIQFISLTDKIKNISSFILIVDFVRNSETFGRYVQHVSIWKFIKEETIDFMKTKLSLFTWNICKSKKDLN